MKLGQVYLGCSIRSACIIGVHTYVLSLIHLLVDYFRQLAEGPHRSVQCLSLLLSAAAVLFALPPAVAAAASAAARPCINCSKLRNYLSHAECIYLVKHKSLHMLLGRE